MKTIATILALLASALALHATPITGTFAGNAYLQSNRVNDDFRTATEFTLWADGMDNNFSGSGDYSIHRAYGNVTYFAYTWNIGVDDFHAIDSFWYAHVIGATGITIFGFHITSFFSEIQTDHLRMWGEGLAYMSNKDLTFATWELTAWGYSDIFMAPFARVEYRASGIAVPDTTIPLRMLCAVFILLAAGKTIKGSSLFATSSRAT